MSKKSPAAVAMGRKGGEARAKKLSAAQRSASAQKAARARYGKADEPPSKWYGLFSFDDLRTPIMSSLDKIELRERAKAEDGACVIELLDYDPRNRMPIVAKYEPDTAARLKALKDLQHIDAGNGGQA